MDNSIGVVIGRFQTHRLHSGHYTLLDYVNKRHNRLLVLLGVRDMPRTRRDPLDWSTRAQMIKAAYPRAVVLPVFDNLSDAIWSKDVDRAIQLLFPVSDATIYGGHDNSLDAYSGKYPVEEVPMLASMVHATTLREEVARTMPPDSQAFREGAIYSVYHNYPRTEISVDVAGLRRNTGGDFLVVMGQKPGEKRYRFPGGFVDPGDQNLAAAAEREFQEETGLTLADVHYVTDYTIQDWRSKDQPDITHRTVLMCGSVWDVNGVKQLRPGDDLAVAEWVPVSRLHYEIDNLVIPEHHRLVRSLVAYLARNHCKPKV